jgi:hypothetical protein
LQRPLNLLWRRQTLEFVVEGYFIKEVLLAEIGRPIRTFVVEANAPVPVLSDTLIVSGGLEFARYLKEARGRGATNIGLLHMGDETGRDDHAFYGDADYVLRHYWFEHLMIPPNPQSLGVNWIPNGYRNGIGPISVQTMLPAAERKIMGFFSGHFGLPEEMKSAERRLMAKVVNDAKIPFLIVETAGWGQGFGPPSYAAWLSTSRFGLVPGGLSPETIRLYEVLEAGAIPIMLKSPYVVAPDALDNPPFVLLNNWTELPEVYARFADANAPPVIAEIEEMRQTVLAWWRAFKAKHQVRIKNLIESSFARVDDPVRQNRL